MNWYTAAILSAFFAALTAILAKIGVKNIDSNLATALRTTVILVFSWSIVLFQKNVPSITTIDRTSAIFLILSGLATGLSWLFYFYALQSGQAAKVASLDKLSLALTVVLAALILKEKISLQTIMGTVLMTIGAFLVAGGK